MRSITALPGQSIFDVALLYCGDAAKAYDIALNNVIPIITTFESNTTLSIPEDTNNISKNFAAQNVKFATGDNINYWYGSDVWNDAAIWNDFYN